jgi:hypothetical protein
MATDCWNQWRPDRRGKCTPVQLGEGLCDILEAIRAPPPDKNVKAWGAPESPTCFQKKRSGGVSRASSLRKAFDTPVPFWPESTWTSGKT